MDKYDRLKQFREDLNYHSNILSIFFKMEGYNRNTSYEARAQKLLGDVRYLQYGFSTDRGIRVELKESEKRLRKNFRKATGRKLRLGSIVRPPRTGFLPTN